jgi:hypothetical protein
VVGVKDSFSKNSILKIVQIFLFVIHLSKAEGEHNTLTHTVEADVYVAGNETESK